MWNSWDTFETFETLDLWSLWSHMGHFRHLRHFWNLRHLRQKSSSLDMGLSGHNGIELYMYTEKYLFQGKIIQHINIFWRTIFALSWKISMLHGNHQSWGWYMHKMQHYFLGNGHLFLWITPISKMSGLVFFIFSTQTQPETKLGFS